VFADLDLLSKLLAPRPSRQAPVIEVLGGQEADVTDDLVARTNALSLEHEEILLGTIPI
jgi:protein SHQ1